MKSGNEAFASSAMAGLGAAGLCLVVSILLAATVIICVSVVEQEKHWKGPSHRGAARRGAWASNKGSGSGGAWSTTRHCNGGQGTSARNGEVNQLRILHEGIADLQAPLL